MQPAEALAQWSRACDAAGIQWYLYKDALLCAEGYRRFPDTLQCAQVAIFSQDLDTVLEQIFPSMPANWMPDTLLFSTEAGALSFSCDGKPVLQIHLLCGVENEAQLKTLWARAAKIRGGARTKRGLLDLLNRMTGHIFGKSINRCCRRIADKSFHALRALAKTAAAAPTLYCDHLTNTAGTLLPAAWLDNDALLDCDGATYPVFTGYRSYLSEVYCDYENGLFDEIGCGLTIDGKAALKEHQAHCRKALAFLNQLSEEFGLRYYLLAGSVLGPVRHGGFIPWDDDVDVGIRIEELPQFEAIVAQHISSRLGEGFHLMVPGPNDPYPRMFSKICYEGRCCIDLWPLVPTYTKGLRAELTWYFAKIITKVHYKKIGQEPNRFVGLVNLMSFFLTDKMVMALARYNERKYANKNAPAYINLYSIYTREKETILRRWLDTEATADFDGLTVPVVGCTEEYLTHLYGNYMALPAPWKRASRHVERFGVSQN